MSKKEIMVCDGCGKTIDGAPVTIMTIDQTTGKELPIHTWQFEGLKLENNGNACRECATVLITFQKAGYDLDFIIGRFDPYNPTTHIG